MSSENTKQQVSVDLMKKEDLPEILAIESDIISDTLDGRHVSR